MLKPLVSVLYRQARSSDEYSCWSKVWIASNGNLERKKSVDTKAICDDYGFDEHTFNLYRFVFAVETALVVNALVMRDVARNTNSVNFLISKTRPTESIFLWWIGLSDCLREVELLFEITKSNTKAGCAEYLISEPLSRAYHDMLPKAVRHTLGAFLTPMPVCEFILEELGVFIEWIKGDCKIIEPSIGFGAFLTALFSMGWKGVLSQEFSKSELVDAISNRFVGLEKNLASFCVARLLSEAFIACLGASQPEATEILWCDSIYVDHNFIESDYQGEIGLSASRTALLANIFTSHSVNFDIAQPVSNQLEISDGIILNEYIDESGIWIHSGQELKSFLNEISQVEAAVIREALNFDGKSQRLGKFEVVVGNPPWVNWENMDPKFRERTTPIWPKLGLFAMKGRDRSFSKEDLCSLATYVACYRFGKLGTKVGLVLPQSVFQARKNSHGFRRFRLGTGHCLYIDKVADLAKAAKFGSAVTRAAILFCELSQVATEYPVRYLMASAGGSKGLQWKEMQAFPSDHSDMQTNWALYSGETKVADDFKKSFAQTTYRARTGVFTGGANAVFYVKIESNDGELISVFNDVERAKIKVPVTKFLAERSFLFPFAKGRDLKFWGCDRPLENGILLAHTRESKIKPVAPAELEVLAPHMLEYLSKHKELLTTRASLTALDKPNVEIGFYAMLRVGDYTFAPYKLAWKYISKDFCCAVIGPTEIAGQFKPTILQEKLISIACETEEEAYFLCGWLSSPGIKADIERRIVGTQVSAHVIQDIELPKFDLHNPIHALIWKICKQGHSQVASGGSLNQSTFDELERLVNSTKL